MLQTGLNQEGILLQSPKDDRYLLCHVTAQVSGSPSTYLTSRNREGSQLPFSGYMQGNARSVSYTLSHLIFITLWEVSVRVPQFANGENEA